MLRASTERDLSVELLGHLPASLLLDRGGYAQIEAVAAGEARAAFVPRAYQEWLERHVTGEDA